MMELRPGTAVPRRVASRYLGERIGCRRRPSGVQPAGSRAAYRSAIRSLRRSRSTAVPLAGSLARLARRMRMSRPMATRSSAPCSRQAAGFLPTLDIPRTGAVAGCRRHSCPRTRQNSRRRGGRLMDASSPPNAVGSAALRRLCSSTSRRASVRTLVTSEQGRNFGPMWLPDGATVLFSSDRGGTPFGIYGADIATGAVRRLVGTGPGAQFPALSPDGRRLVFVGYTADGYDLYSIPFDAPQWADMSGSAPDSRRVRRNRRSCSSRGPRRCAVSSLVDARAALLGPGHRVDARRCPDRREHERVRCTRAPRLRRDRNVGGSTKRSQLAGRLLVRAVVARAVRWRVRQHRGLALRRRALARGDRGSVAARAPTCGGRPRRSLPSGYLMTNSTARRASRRSARPRHLPARSSAGAFRARKRLATPSAPSRAHPLP